MILREDIVTETLGWLGTPYRHQASIKGVGCDCLGLVRGVWRGLIGEEPETLPAYTANWAESSCEERMAVAAGRHFDTIHAVDIQPGDIILFRWRAHLPAKHAGIVVPGDRFVHAFEGASVVSSQFAGWWRRRIAYAFQFPGVID